MYFQYSIPFYYLDLHTLVLIFWPSPYTGVKYKFIKKEPHALPLGIINLPTKKY